MITQEDLKKEVVYNPDTGIFYWNKSWGKKIKDKEVGYLLPQGYMITSISSRKYMLHRLAWLYMYGYLPDKNLDIDHINGDRKDNRINNLRLVTRSENNFNQRKYSKNNKCKYLGVSLHKHSGLYRATIFVNYIQKCIGYFKTPEEAYEAYVNEKRRIHNTCTI